MNSSIPAWAWIPIVLAAAAAQTVRNTAQRKLTGSIGTLPATLVRFLFGLPFAAFWLFALWLLLGQPALPRPGLAYGLWLLLGAVAQIAATACLLRAMRERNFIVAVTWSKTEVLQVALFSVVFLAEWPGAWAALAMFAATAGVVLLALPREHAGEAGWFSASAAWGVASGAGFALSAVGYRGAALELAGLSPWITGALGVLLAQTLQSLLLGGWLAWRDRAGLAAMSQAWRLSLLAGSMGAMASIGWFTGFALRPAADVRTLGMVEVVFSYVVSTRLLREKLATRELAGLGLVLAGLLVLCARL